MKVDLPQGLWDYEECDIETMWIHLVVWQLFVPRRFGEIKKMNFKSRDAGIGVHTANRCSPRVPVYPRLSRTTLL